jgi:hypothetical protein
MCDQLRYRLSRLHRPPDAEDAEHRRHGGARRALLQGLCAVADLRPSRMSFYTGRYMRSHGSHWNGWPLRVGEPTLGDHLKKIGVRNVLVGKTHMAPISKA